MIMPTLNLAKGMDTPCKTLGVMVLVAGLGRWQMGKDRGLETQALPPVFPCPPLPSLGPGVLMCKNRKPG